MLFDLSSPLTKRLSNALLVASLIAPPAVPSNSLASGVSRATSNQTSTSLLPAPASSGHRGRQREISHSNEVDVHINPDSLRRMLINGNVSVLLALNSVSQAKATVNLARGNLLPSISVSATTSAFSGGAPSFALGSVSFLLPFLLPSNWFALSANEHQFAASGYAYNLVELNEYASAFALYHTILADIETLKVYQTQYTTLEKLRELVEAKVILGTATTVDLAQATGQAQLGAAQVAQVEELIRQEKAAFRKMLALPLNRNLIFDESHPEPLSAEDTSAQKILNHVFPVSNEELQVRSLIEAARSAVWTKAFSFLGGASLDMVSAGGSDMPLSFSTLVGSGSANIGFGYFPSIQLSNFDITQLQLRERELRLQMASTIESALGSLKAAKVQYSNASLARESYVLAYKGQIQNYQLGSTDLLNVLTAVTNVTGSSVTRARARADLDNQRVSLYRMTVTGQFGRIPFCRILGNESSTGPIGPLSWITDLFDPDGTATTVRTVDQLCRRPRQTAVRR